MPADHATSRPLGTWLQRAVPRRPLSPTGTMAALAFGLQFVFLAVWSYFLLTRFSLTYDFATYYQGVWLLWHGHADPYSTVLGLPLWANGGQAVFWLLAGLTWLTRSPLALLWVQDIAIVGTGLVAYLWTREVIGAHTTLSPRAAAALQVAALGLLTLNPWIYDAASFDIHTETLCSLPLISLGWALYRRANPAIVFGLCALVLTGGMVACTYIVGLGLSLLLFGRTRLHFALTFIVAGIGYFFVLNSLVGANELAPFGMTYGYLLGNVPHASTANLPVILRYVITHPASALRQLIKDRFDILADLSAGGIIGALSRWAIGVTTVTILANVLSRAFAAVAFQNFPMYGFITVGSIGFLGSWAATGYRWRIVGMPLIVAIASLQIGYFVIWAPRVETTWVRTSPATAQALTLAESTIPPGAQVVVSQGVAGAFAGRAFVSTLLISGPQAVHLDTPSVYFVLAPYAGIETVPAIGTEQVLAELASQPNARVLLARAGVWLVRYHHAPAQHSLIVDTATTSLPAWTLSTPAGHPELDGSESHWTLSSSARQGYVASGDYWIVPPGHYCASVALRVQGTATVEVWNDSDGRLLRRRVILSTHGLSVITLPLSIHRAELPHVYSGWGPFRLEPIEPHPGTTLEIRVFVPRSSSVAVTSLGLKACPG